MITATCWMSLWCHIFTVRVTLNIMTYKVQNTDYKILKTIYKLKIQDTIPKYKTKNRKQTQKMENNCKYGVQCLYLEFCYNIQYLRNKLIFFNVVLCFVLYSVRTVNFPMLTTWEGYLLLHPSVYAVKKLVDNVCIFICIL